MGEASENRQVTGLSTNRLVAFSDGVFAVAITLLVLNLQVPQIATGSELVSRLGALWPKLLSYALSFVVVCDERLPPGGQEYRPTPGAAGNTQKSGGATDLPACDGHLIVQRPG